MFINLSNHSSDKWSNEQREAASRFGKMVDLPFPVISPEDDGSKIKKLAAEYFKECIRIAGEPAEETAFHIMGEQVFCFFLIQALLKAGYAVYASTSQRNVVDEVNTGNNNRKTTVFTFVKFRKYELWEEQY